MAEAIKKRSGRPKKAESDKVRYQRIAVYAQDYSKLLAKITKLNKNKLKTERIKLTDAFTEMVGDYLKK